MKTHQSLFQYLLCSHKHVQYITVPDGLHKSHNDRSAEQETVDMTLRMTTTSPKFQRGL